MCKHKSGGMSRPSGKPPADGDAQNDPHRSTPPHGTSAESATAYPHRTDVRRKKPIQPMVHSTAVLSAAAHASRFPECYPCSYMPVPMSVPTEAGQHIKRNSEEEPHVFVCSLEQISSWDGSMHPNSGCEYEDRVTEESPMLLSHNPCSISGSGSSVVLATNPCDLPLLHIRNQSAQQFVDCRKVVQSAECLCASDAATPPLKDRRQPSCDKSAVKSSRGEPSSLTVGPGCAVIFDTSQDLIELDEDSSSEDYFEMRTSYATNSVIKAGRSRAAHNGPQCHVGPQCSARTAYSSFFSLASSCQSSNVSLNDTRLQHYPTTSHNKQISSVFRIDVPSDRSGSGSQDLPTDSRSSSSSVNRIERMASNLPCPILSLTPAVDFTLNSDSDSSYELEDSCMHFGEESTDVISLPQRIAAEDWPQRISSTECHLQPKALPSLPSAAQLSLASSSGDSNAPMCKICHTATKEGDPLISPCRCSGTMQYIHCGCLMKWLEISSKRSRKPASCELCQYQYHWHKKFKVRHWQFPPCSRRDKILHLLFLLSVMVMVACATVTVMCFKQDKGMKVDPERTELTQSEIVTLVCGVLFFLAFFVAMYVEVKARNTIYKLLVKFVYINQQWYIDEYEKKTDSNNSGPVDV